MHSPLKFPGAAIIAIRPSRNFMRSIPKSLRRPNTYSSGRKPSDRLRRLRTTVIRHFLARKKLSKKPDGRTPSGPRVCGGKTKPVHAKAQSSQSKGVKNFEKPVTNPPLESAFPCHSTSRHLRRVKKQGSGRPGCAGLAWKRRKARLASERQSVDLKTSARLPCGAGSNQRS